MIAILFLSVLTLTLLGFKSSKDLASSVDFRSIVTLIVFSVLLFHLSMATILISSTSPGSILNLSTLNLPFLT